MSLQGVTPTCCTFLQAQDGNMHVQVGVARSVGQEGARPGLETRRRAQAPSGDSLLGETHRVLKEYPMAAGLGGWIWPSLLPSGSRHPGQYG